MRPNGGDHAAALQRGHILGRVVTLEVVLDRGDAAYARNCRERRVGFARQHRPRQTYTPIVQNGHVDRARMRHDPSKFGPYALDELARIRPALVEHYAKARRRPARAIGHLAPQRIQSVRRLVCCPCRLVADKGATASSSIRIQ
jgi:hypothetical protein